MEIALIGKTKMEPVIEIVRVEHGKNTGKILVTKNGQRRVLFKIVIIKQL